MLGRRVVLKIKKKVIVAGGGEIPLTGLGRRKVEKVEGRAGEYVQTPPAYNLLFASFQIVWGPLGGP